MSPTFDSDIPRRSALVVFGTETGNSQDVAFEISQSLGRLHFATNTQDLDAVALSSLLQYDLVVIAISTTGQGDFPSNARKFWSSLLRRKLTSRSLIGCQYAVIGLCDSSYPKFNLAGRKLHKRLQQLGAKSLVEPCEADEQGEEGTEGVFLSWLPIFLQSISEVFPLPAGLSPIPNDEKLSSSWILAEVGVSTDDFADGRVAESNAHARSDLFKVRLLKNERVTPSTHWQDVRFMKFESEEPVQYMPGDALAIHPQNLPGDVNQLLELLGWQQMADKRLKIQWNSDVQRSNNSVPPLPEQATFTLRKLLTEYLDINAIPRRSFFAHIAHLTDDEMQKERALEFTDPQYLDEYFDYATRPRRSILEVLQEFNTVDIPWQEAINVFPILRPRQFSIASGGILKDNGRTFELLVAIVKYRTVIKRIREGVCTKYLARLPENTTLNVSLQREGRFHDQTSMFDRPYLLIGGGTGIAPLRSIIYEKQLLQNCKAKSTLLFGCRNAKSDYFFGTEWQEWEDKASDTLQVVTAFSRDQVGKVYVQDRIREHEDLVYKILNNPEAVIVVCGSSGAMPKAVRQALKDVLSTRLYSETIAEDALINMEKQERYKQETW